MICQKPYQKIVQKLHQDYMCLTFFAALYKIRWLPCQFSCCRVVWGGGVVFRSAVGGMLCGGLSCVSLALYGLFALRVVCWSLVVLSCLVGACMGCGLLFVRSPSGCLLFVGVPCPCGAVWLLPWVFPCLIRSRGLWGLLGGFGGVSVGFLH